MKFEHREPWLNALMVPIRDWFQGHGYVVPEHVRVTCGWPSKLGVGAKKRRIGECWDDAASTDRHFEIFISPVLGSKPTDVLKIGGVLVHEVVHAVVGLKAKHGKAFGACAAKVGLTKPWTATGETEELIEAIRGWVDKLGPYPHGALKPGSLEKETEKGRMMLMQCQCGLKIRTTRKWIDQYGEEWPCPCGASLRFADPEEE